MTRPMNQIVQPGAVATFNCHARGTNVYWLVDRDDPYPQSDYEARGFNFTYVAIPRAPNELGEYNNTITVEARPSNNDTTISCVAQGSPSQHEFEEGRLVIARK